MTADDAPDPSGLPGTPGSSGPPGAPPTDPVVLPAAVEPRALPAAEVDPASIDGLAVTGPWGRATVAELFERHGGLGLVVLHRGRLVAERYPAGRAPDRANPCFSVTKSFTGTNAARVIAAGRLDRAASVADVVPELAETGFGSASVGDLADMTASIGYDEDYDETSPTAEPGWFGFGDYLAALGMAEPVGPDRPRDLRALSLAMPPGRRPHGEAFAYATPVTDALGWTLERAEGRDGAAALAELWASLGPEHEARLLRDPAGTALLGAGLVVSTRDLARFGAALADGGRGPGGPVVPESVIEEIRDGGDPEVFARDGHYAYLTGYSYRDQWWLPGGPTRPLSAWGIHGQVLWVDPDAEVVVAIHCGGPLASDAQRDLEQDALCRALVEASSGWA